MMEVSWYDWSMRKRILHVAPFFCSNALVAFVDLPWERYPTASEPWFSLLVSVLCHRLAPLRPDSSSTPSSSSLLWASANFVPSLGMNLLRRLALKDPGSGSPLRDANVYELRSLVTTRCGIDHLGSNLRSVLNV